jgi:general secretion pathway protein D
VNIAVRDYFEAAGVSLLAPKMLYFNDRTGLLMVRATLDDLEIIAQAVEVLNYEPPQITIEARFVEVSQSDTRALGFNWILGNTLIGPNGGTAVAGGTQPQFNTGLPPTAANPAGTFPFPGVTPNPIPPAVTDGNFTQGLRNMANAPALFSVTGILTDPQFKVVITALDQREGTDLMFAPRVTTLSGRQTQIKAVLVQTIITGISQNGQTGGGTGGAAVTVGGGGGGTVAAQQPTTQPFEFGPVLDVIPYVSADGHTIQMTIIPTLTRFDGYDDPGVYTSQIQSGSGNTVGNALTLPTPLPRFQLRQVATSVNVWDGQTVVIGGLLSETVRKVKDKVPILGDLPYLGRFFRSESQSTQKRNLIIFVTPTIIDPAGNLVNDPDEQPFAKQGLSQLK